MAAGVIEAERQRIMTPRPEYVSVVLPVGQALEHVRRVLFQPIDLAKWFAIGFCAWLAELSRGGMGGGPHFNLPGGTGDLRQLGEQARDYIVGNLHWLVPVVAGVGLFVLAFWVLILWLSSRGRFMFLHCVALNRAQVAAPWHEYAREANSLFWFRLVLGFISLLPILPLLVVLVVGAWKQIEGGAPSAAGILALVGIGLLLTVVGLIFWLIGKLTTDFVVPVMYLRRSQCLSAWGSFLRLVSANSARFVLYLLFQIVLGMAIGMLVVAVILVTCCCAGCLMAIPYVGTVVLLPVLMFHRAYTAFYLAQYGPEYNVFLTLASPAAGQAPPNP